MAAYGRFVKYNIALHLGRKVVASDVIERPAGTVCFRNRDQPDLDDVVRSVMQPEDRQISDSFDGLTFAETYLDIYGCH